MRSKGGASKERRDPIFVTLSLWVKCSLTGSHSILAKATNIGSLLSLEAAYWLQEQNQTLLLHSSHLTQKKLKMILCPVLILADTGDFIKRERSTLKKKVLFQQYDQLTKQYL